MDIDGAHALITGGASGLGLATARRLLARGARVLLVDLPTSSGAARAAELEPGADFIAVDVTDEAQVIEAVRRIADAGPLRIVVNCAGVAAPGKLLGKAGPLPTSEFLRVLAINLGGTMTVCAQAAARMRENEPVGEERGVIINTASVAAFEGQIGQIAYAASKGGVAAMTLPMARELAAQQIRVVTIAPGLFETPMMAGLPDAARDALVDTTLHPHRLGRAEEYAALVEHIVDNPMLNGATLRLDGAVRLEPR